MLLSKERSVSAGIEGRLQGRGAFEPKVWIEHEGMDRTEA